MPNYLYAAKRYTEPTTLRALIDKGVTHVWVVGHLSQDPLLRFGASGTPVCKASIPVSWGKRDDPARVTEWCNIVAFKDNAELLSHHVKGDCLNVGGKIELERPWTDRSGTERQNVQLLIDAFGPTEWERPQALVPPPTSAIDSRDSDGLPF